MIRRIEQTVRFPVARMAPTARNWALTQVRLENSGAKAAKEATISGGRSTAVVPGAMARQSPSILVNARLEMPVNSAKVEGQRYVAMPIRTAVSFSGVSLGR